MTQNSKLTGASAFAKRVGKLIPKLAQGKEDILLIGEQGSGRKTIAFEIHVERGRKKPIVLIDGTTATDAEVRAVLADADATTAETQTGRRMASPVDNGSVVIADLDKMAPHNQAVLVAFMKEGRRKHTGLKIMVTVSDQLVRLAQSGAIGIDMLAFLEKFEAVEIPPLRDRIEDISSLVTSLTKALCTTLGKPMKEIDQNTIHILSQGQWPGNVKQLAGVIGKAVMISHGDVLELPNEFLDERQHLTDAVENIHGAKVFVLDQSLDIIEKLLIQRALKQFLYNQSKTAQVLGLSEANFRYRLKKFGLPSIRQKV